MGYQHARFLSLATVLPLIVAAAGCLDDDPDTGPATGTSVSAVTTTEGFEAGTKTAYAAADVALSSGTWNLNDALIGTSTSDVFTGTRSGRLRNSGRITMGFDRATGAGTVTIHHASFGTDTSGSWGLFYSQNQGAAWTQVGASQTTATGAFATASFTVNRSGTIRFEIRKLDGGANRINIDDISITDFTGGGAALSIHTALGIPAPTSTTDPNRFLSVKSGHVLSYNGSRKVPNWVSWELNTSYLGASDRQDDFRPDDTFPASEPQASLADYSGSGYDRGHMCPSADRTLTIAANQQTFYLTNMVPQSAHNNRGPWARLESDLRDIALTGKELFIIAGGTFSASSNTIGSGVVVPDQTFKVIVVLDAVNQGASAVTASTRVIGVMMPNEDAQISQSADWHTFRVSVDAIEAATGDDFLSDVDPAVQAVVEARVDNL
jgi:endonuclease G, mitochondrial